MNFYYHNINLTAVLVSAVAAFIVSWLWFSSFLFGKAWMQATNRSEDEIRKQTSGGALAIAFICAILIAFILAHIINLALGIYGPSFLAGIRTAFLCWFAFVFLVQYVTIQFENSSRTLFLINTSHRLVEFLVMGAILTLWR